MLIKDYDLEVFTPPCDPGASKFAAIARLTVDIREVLPYFNAALGPQRPSPMQLGRFK